MQDLYCANNPLEAHLICGALAQIGIEAYIAGEALSGAIGLLPVDVLQVWIQVADDDLPKALCWLELYLNNQLECSDVDKTDDDQGYSSV